MGVNGVSVVATLLPPKIRNPAMVCTRALCGPPGARELSSGAGSLSCSDAAVLAAERGEEAAVLAWLDGGGRADATYERRGVSGITLLMGAAHQGHERVVELLLRRGAKVNLKDSKGGTALMLAAHYGNERVVELLLQHGAEVNLQNSIGDTALMFSHRQRPRAGDQAAASAWCGDQSAEQR